MQILKTLLGTPQMELNEFNISVSVTVLHYMMIRELSGLQTN